MRHFAICSLISVFTCVSSLELPLWHLQGSWIWRVKVVFLQSTFFCECEDGYTGIFCEEFDACHHRPCRNNGTCTDVRQGGEGRNFTCTCPPGVCLSMCASYLSTCSGLYIFFHFVCVDSISHVYKTSWRHCGVSARLRVLVWLVADVKLKEILSVLENLWIRTQEQKVLVRFILGLGLEAKASGWR